METIIKFDPSNLPLPDGVFFCLETPSGLVRIKPGDSIVIHPDGSKTVRPHFVLEVQSMTVQVVGGFTHG